MTETNPGQHQSFTIISNHNTQHGAVSPVQWGVQGQRVKKKTNILQSNVLDDIRGHLNHSLLLKILLCAIFGSDLTHHWFDSVSFWTLLLSISHKVNWFIISFCFFHPFSHRNKTGTSPHQILSSVHRCDAAHVHPSVRIQVKLEEKTM